MATVSNQTTFPSIRILLLALSSAISAWGAKPWPTEALELAFPGGPAGSAAIRPAEYVPLEVSLARTRGNPAGIEVVFTAPVAAATATNPANYAIAPAVPVQSVRMGSDSATVWLATGPMASGVAHTLSISGVQDLSLPPNTVPPNTSLPILKAQGVISRKVFTGLANGTLTNLASQPKFPDQPDGSDFLAVLEIPSDAANLYGTQVAGFLHPPVTGDYYFYLAADNQGALYLSPDANPANKVELIRVLAPTGGARQWTVSASQQSAAMRLEGGKSYYLEGLMAEGDGADYLAVTWRLRGMPLPANGAPPIPGEFLSSLVPSGPASLAAQPQPVTVPEWGSATFSGVAGGTPPYAWQWLRDGLEIPGANEARYTMAAASMSDQGARFAVRVENSFSSVTSGTAVLTVQADLAPPALVRVAGSPTMDRVSLSFSKPLDPATAMNPRIYALDGGLAVLGARLLSGQSNVVLFTTRQREGQRYALDINGIRDNSASHNAAALSTHFTAWVATRGFARREVFNGIAGATLAELTNHYKFPELPDAAGYVGQLEAPGNAGDSYGQRLMALVQAPVTGYYRFYIASDDEGALFLSTDETAANLRRIAREPQYNSARNWVGTDRRTAASPENRSQPILLQAGQRYYLEALMKENTQTDNLAVLWQPPGAPAPTNGAPPIPGAWLHGFAEPGAASLSITQQPQSLVVLENATAAFSVRVAATGPVFYQWQKNGVDLDGAGGSNYLAGPLARDEGGARFRCLVTVPGLAVGSSEAVLTVTPDTTTPQLVSAAALAGAGTVGLVFSEAMSPAGATNPAHYAASTGARIAKANLRADGQSASLSLAALAYANFSLAVSNLADLSGRNFIPNGASVPVEVQSLDAQDVGTAGVDPKEPGSTFTGRLGDFEVIMGGSQIGGVADAFHFVSELREGDFDLKVRVARFTGVRAAWAGIMIRANLSPGSPCHFAGLQPADGNNYYSTTWRSNQAAQAATVWPNQKTSPGVPLPNAWLRLQRQGNTLTAYRGTNGTLWTQYAQAAVTYSNRVYVGLASCAAQNVAGQTGSVWYRDFQAQPAGAGSGRVDLLVKTAVQPEANYALNDVYQALPSGAQACPQLATVDSAAGFQVKVENDSAYTQSPVIRATESPETGWSVLYRAGTNDISSLVRSANGYVVSNLLAGAAQILSVEFLPGDRILAGTRKTAVVKAGGAPFASTLKDVVQLEAIADPVYQPDLMIRRLTDVNYRGEGIFNNTGADQSKTLSVEPGLTATYQVQAVNRGNRTNLFQLSGTSSASGWTVRYLDALNGGADVTADMAGRGTLISLVPGGSWEYRVEMTPGPLVADGSSNTVLVTAQSVNYPAHSDTVAAITICQPPSTSPLSGTYTTDADFERGTLAGTEYAGNQVQLARESLTLPFIWVPNSNEGTVSKVDTRTGRELGRYRTGPNSGPNPSRTTVDQYGNCWVGNRNSGSVVKIGLYENGQFIDRNTNGVIETSQDLNGDGNITGSEILAWGQDECVLVESIIIPGREGAFAPGKFTGTYGGYGNAGARSIAVDWQGNIWAGNYTAKTYYHLENATGRILRTNDVSPTHTPYGAVVDGNGILWSSSLAAHVMRLNPADNTFSLVNIGHTSYGLGLDRNGHLFVSGWDSSSLTRINVNTGVKDWTITAPNQTKGVAVGKDGDVWVAGYGGNNITRWTPDGVLKAAIPVGTNPTGVSVDPSGKVWAVDLGDEFIYRVDPATDLVDLTKRLVGTTHYGYSDMTGLVARNATIKYGAWTVIHDAQLNFAPWGNLAWHASDPTGSNLVVRVRSANTLGFWSDWEIARSGSPLQATPPGRYLQVEAGFRAALNEASPVLYDLSVAPLAQRVADLSVTQSFTPATPVNQKPFTLTVAVANRGPDEARGVVLNNQLSVELPVVSATVSQGSLSRTGNVVRCQLGNLAAGASATLTLVFLPNAEMPVTNTTSLASYEIDPAPANNRAVLAAWITAPGCAAPPEDLVAWWPGEGNGFDLVSTNHAQYDGAVTNLAGKVGQAFVFNGANAYLKVPAATNLNVGAAEGLTIEAWIKPGDLTSRPLLEWPSRSTGWGLHFWSSVASSGGGAGSLYANLADVDRKDHICSTAPGVLVAGVWQHVALTYEKAFGNARFYVNGTNVATKAVGIFTPQTGTDLHVGFRPSSNYRFLGAMDEISLYKRALAEMEIAAIYAASYSGKCQAEPPALKLGRDLNRDLILSWPASATGFGLEYSTSLGQPAWSLAAETPALNGDRYEIKLQSPLGTIRIYRLRRP